VPGFDAIVIGSGFGGSVTACRLAEAGHKVLVLERGRRWASKDLPRAPGDAWIWDQYRPEKRNGWLDLRIFPDMVVAAGAAVGGGSLIYANVSINAKPDSFDQGWPPEITYRELKPHYDTVGRMLNLQKLPPNQLTARVKLLKEGAEKLGHGDKFEQLDLAVSFDPAWNYEQQDPFNPAKSKKFINAFGREQGTCVHLGNCDIGCDVGAKNTLDMNYLAQAENKGAQVRSLHMVRAVSPEAGGYRVSFDRLEGGTRVPGSETARIVIVSAGSLGSTELLLRCRDQHRTLPEISSFLGRNWSSNGDLVTPSLHIGRLLRMSRGPTIAGAVDFLGPRALDGHHLYLEEGGLPNVVRTWLEKAKRDPMARLRYAAMTRAVLHGAKVDKLFDEGFLWFGQSRDAADGRFRLRRRWWGVAGQKKLHLDWDIKASEATMNAFAALHRRMAVATGGTAFVLPTWTVLKNLVTPHPLGGCNMGTSPENGVVDHRGEVFGYRNLFVLDGAIVPEALGLNPSKTIAALAERAAGTIVKEGR